MRKYELMYIIRPNIEDEAKTALVERFDGVITNNGGEIAESKDWGKRRLAYEINDFRDGYYRLMKISGEPAVVEEFTRLAKINDNIIRHIVIKEDK